MYWEKVVLGNFAKFTGKHLYQSIFLNKVSGLRPANLLKRDSRTGAFLWILRNFSEHLFLRNTSGGCLWKTENGFLIAYMCLLPNLWKSNIEKVHDILKLMHIPVNVSWGQPTFIFQNQQSKHQNNIWNLFKVNKKDTRTASENLT